MSKGEIQFTAMEMANVNVHLIRKDEEQSTAHIEALGLLL